MSLPAGATSKMDVCQKCGDKGDKKRLVHCIKCQVAAEHSYCFDTLPTKWDKNIIWTCEECIPREAKPIPQPAIRSARISRAVENKWNRIETRRRMSFSTLCPQPCTYAEKWTNSVQSTVSSHLRGEIEKLPSESGTQPTDNPCCVKNEIENLSLSSRNAGHEESLKPKRRLVIEDESSDEESESIKRSIGDPLLVHVVNAYPSVYSATKNYVHAHPVVDPIWRGCLRIENNDNALMIGVVAHLSTKSCAKVKEAIKELPMLLTARTFPRRDVWPWKLENEQPTDECIGLYLFPENERDEKCFDDLMDEMIIHDQALKVVMKTVQLFVFSSRQLPPEHWRFCKKYYLWGAFKSARRTFQDNHELKLD